MKRFLILILLGITEISFAQLPIGFDTITVFENNQILKMPWAGGLNYSNFSNIDLNNDGKKDLVAFDKMNQFGVGRFRCFIKQGNAGQVKYVHDPKLSYSFPQLVTNWAILQDFNCDGKEDIFCSANGGITVYKNVSSASTVSFTLEKPLLYTYYFPSVANLYASSAGVPGIADVDNDGDLDVMTFAPQGIFVEYHQNMSMEAFGNCNSLDTFQLNTACWGKIIENNCQVSFGQTCAMKPWPSYYPELQQNRHAGSCLTCVDVDGDTDKDLIMGDISCNHVQLAFNTGSANSALVTDTTKMFPNFPAKNNTTQIKMNNFPCTYIVDVDGDNRDDLIATPNANGSENYKSVWYYKNTSSTPTVNFQFVQNNLLQDNMIEVGQNSYPVIFDENADGKKDLLVGTFGYYSTNSLQAKLTLYRNTGTNAQPSYSLITRDFASLSLTDTLSYAIPSVGDMDNDGDVDIVIGTSQGKVHLLKNTAGPGNPCVFTNLIKNPYNFTSPTAIAAVQIYDINKDGKPDLMLGGQKGKINYFKNIGTSSAPSFTKQSEFFGKINVQANPNYFGIDGYSAPHFYEDNGTKLLVGSVNGNIFHYSIPPLVNDTCTAVLISGMVNGINEGAQSAPFYEDVNNDGLRDLFIGNAAGGLSFLSSKAPDVGIIESVKTQQDLFTVYPVPAREELFIQYNGSERDERQMSLFDVSGKLVYSHVTKDKTHRIEVKDLRAGLYFLKISGSGTNSTKKVILE